VPVVGVFEQNQTTVAGKAAFSGEVERVSEVIEQLKETETALKNVLKAIEQGIIFPTTLNRVQELEEKKAALTAELEVQEIKTPVLTVEQIAFWLEKFCKGDTKSPTYRRRIVDTLINKVYLFDLPGGGTRITILCNTTNGNTIEISCSDIVGYAPQKIRTWPTGSGFSFSFWLHGRPPDTPNHQPGTLSLVRIPTAND
jgi:hypothetical protein